jgi:hypothetical protein
MARLARVVVPGIPHHITQRGNRRQEVFFRDEDEDYQEYLGLISHGCKEEGVAACFLDNQDRLAYLGWLSEALEFERARGSHIAHLRNQVFVGNMCRMRM